MAINRGVTGPGPASAATDKAAATKTPAIVSRRAYPLRRTRHHEAASRNMATASHTAAALAHSTPTTSTSRRASSG